MLDTLEPKKIIIVSSAPQIRYPDCYGIDMSRMQDFIAFRALLELLEDTDQSHLLKEAHKRCKKAKKENALHEKNHLREVYKQFSTEQISNKIAQIIGAGINAEVQVVYQSISNLHKACPNHLGDWYFTGKYPTPGGNKVVNRAFMNFMEGKDGRAY